MDKISHDDFEDALQRVASVLDTSIQEVRGAIDAFYKRVSPKKVKDPNPGKALSTEVVPSPEVRPPVLQKPSVSLEIEGRLPVEIGRSTWKVLDKEKRELVERSKIVARRMDLRFNEKPRVFDLRKGRKRVIK